MTDPTAILQAHINRISAAALSHDWPTYRDCLCLPCAMISKDASTIITTEPDLRIMFDAFHATLRANHVTDYVKQVETARFLDKDLISGSYMSHISTGGHLVLPPFRSMLDLRLEAGLWRTAAVTNALRRNQLSALQADSAPVQTARPNSEGQGG